MRGLPSISFSFSPGVLINSIIQEPYTYVRFCLTYDIKITLQLLFRKTLRLYPHVQYVVLA